MENGYYIMYYYMYIFGVNFLQTHIFIYTSTLFVANGEI